ILTLTQCFEQMKLVNVKKKLAGYGLTKIAVFHFDQKVVSKIVFIAVKSQLIFIFAFGLKSCSFREQQPGLPYLIERDICKCDIRLKLMGVPAPFSESLTKD